MEKCESEGWMVTDCGRGEILKSIMLEKVPLLLMQVLSCVCDWGGEENKTVESKKNTKLRGHVVGWIIYMDTERNVNG